jgi:branched-chain amino acid transport system permease protein
MTVGVLEQSIFNGFSSAGIYIMIALGLTLVLSIMGIVQMAHGEIYMIASYAVYYLFAALGLNFFLALILSASLVGGFGILLERLCFRPFRQKPMRALIISIGLILVLQNVVLSIAGGDTKAYNTPFPGVLRVMGVTMVWDRLVIIIVALVMLIGLFLFLKMTKTGQAMTAISQDLKGAALQGINIDRLSALAMFMGCALAAVSGALVGALFGLSPSMGGFALTKGIAVIVLGGLGSLSGAVVGGLILGMIDGIMPGIATTYVAGLVGYGVIIVIMIFRPQGLWGHE